MKLNLLPTAILILVSFHLDAQMNSLKKIYPKGAKKEWEISFSFDRSFSSIPDIVTSMITSESTEGSTSYDSGTNSVVNKLSLKALDLKYNISQRSGISFVVGRLNAFTIIPGDRYIHPDGWIHHFPRVKSILNAMSLNYVYSFGHNRHELSSGISIISYQMKPVNKTDNLTTLHARTKNVGINLGYAFHVIEAKGFFLAFHAQYTLAGTPTIGPYSITRPSHDYDFLNLGWITGTTPTSTTSFPKTKVNLSTFNIGFSMGFRFGNEVGSTDTIPNL